MDNNERIHEISIDKVKEDALFSEILGANKHITASQHVLLRVWVRLMLRIEEMPATRELLRYSQESRLLGHALKLMPERKEDVTIDLTTAMQEAMVGHNE